jgi:hypothetical protein
VFPYGLENAAEAPGDFYAAEHSSRATAMTGAATGPVVRVAAAGAMIRTDRPGGAGRFEHDR